MSLFYTIHHIQPHEYIDEEFHVPQAQKFCEGKIREWDPKITTPPGLYIVSLFLLTPYFWLKGILDCNIANLRLVNVIASTFNFILLLILRLKPFYQKNNNVIRVLDAASLAAFPILYFFSFLYYTDAVSTFFVLAMYTLHLFDRNFHSAAAGLVAICIRQTNIIWVAYCAILKGYTTLIEILKSKRTIVRRKSPLTLIWEGLHSPQIIVFVLSKTIWHILVGVLFIAFVAWNGSIVLGDKTAHEATFHLPQIFYFLVCVALFTPLHFVNYFPTFMQKIKKKKVQTLILLIISLMAVHLNTLAHPYLLADNRHYTFYIWKRIFESNAWARYALCPLYIYCLYCVNDSLKLQGLVTPMVKFALALCVSATLIPQRLLEPRYFILPYLMVKMNFANRGDRYGIFVTTDLYVAILVNIVTIYIYCACPFAKDSCVRFIW
ncbi:hypothetical protein B566_EDAN016951 [Ephemera danica]|nr:hypothetical protein B566_EDAN016951 [Ephemera danica]